MLKVTTFSTDTTNLVIFYKKYKKPKGWGENKIHLMGYSPLALSYFDIIFLVKV